MNAGASAWRRHVERDHLPRTIPEHLDACRREGAGIGRGLALCLPELLKPFVAGGPLEPAAKNELWVASRQLEVVSPGARRVREAERGIRHFHDDSALRHRECERPSGCGGSLALRGTALKAQRGEERHCRSDFGQRGIVEQERCDEYHLIV